ncbi:MAG: spore coat protein U domain-containing protein [Rhizobacter sp.]|nr:spore coat protein U domain-containing protein [Bacteriovorax sp.]
MKIKILFMLSFFVTAIAFADCKYTLQTPTFTYGIGDTNPTSSGTVTIERTASNSDVCSNFFLAFTKGWAGNYNRRALNQSNGDLIYYNIYKNNNTTGVLKEPSDITTVNEVLYGTIAKDQSINLTYFFTLAPLSASSPPSSGTYIDVVQVQAYSGTYTNINSYEGYRDLYIYLNVAKFVSLSMVDTGGVYDANSVSKTLDFGELTENESLSFDVRIVSNAGYILKVASVNNGQMLRVGGSGSNSLIPYDFYASGSKKSLSSSAADPVTIASGTGKTASGGAVVPVKVTIGSMGTDKDPGTYQDYLTLSVISND